MPAFARRRRPAEGPFHIGSPFRDPLRRTLFSASKPALNQALALPRLNRLYARIAAMPDDGRHFCARALDAMGVAVETPTEHLQRLPATGPLVVVANHPFGGIEGLALPSLMLRVRPDVRIMANFILHMIPEMRDIMIFVDPFGGPEAIRKNLSALRDSIRHVEKGGCLCVFPAGAVSHLNIRSRSVIDPPWSDTIARIVRRTHASVCPVFFDGRNSHLFQALGLIHPRLRTVMLPRELLRKQRRSITLGVGSPIPFKRLESFADDQAVTDYLRVRTYLLKSRSSGESVMGSSPLAREEPIIPPVPPQALTAEVAALPPEQQLVVNDNLLVYYATAAQIPNLLREIGRLRETNFRAVGEGTGKPIDLDPFDDTYKHLFIWDIDKQRLAGAYRLGPTDEILPRLGKTGLYTSTLFRYKDRLLQQISPGLEMGRSFVDLPYQRSFAPLMLLWKGIGHYLVKFPRYRYVFGPVSISNQYSSVSKQLLVTFLKFHRFLPGMAKLLKPVNPPKRRRIDYITKKQTSTVVRDVEEVNDLLRDLEADGKAMPVLLRQYLKLNAKLLGFNIDPDFGDVLDGLILIDATQIDDKLMNRYFTEEGKRAYLKHHGVKRATSD